MYSTDFDNNIYYYCAWNFLIVHVSAFVLHDVPVSKQVATFCGEYMTLCMQYDNVNMHTHVRCNYYISSEATSLPHYIIRKL